MWSSLSPTFFQLLILLSGLIALLDVGSTLIGRFVAPFLEELEQELDQPEAGELRPIRGLRRAGSVIGALERLLVYILVIAGHPAAIGFLLAAKSIFRFGDIRERARRMESEYILIGTLASFAYALVVSNGVTLLIRALDSS